MRDQLALTAGTSPNQLWINVWLVAVIAGPLLTLLHEGGHVVAARLAGFPVRALVIGKGRAVIRRRIRGVLVEIRSIPYGGLTVFEPVDSPTVGRREGLVAAAGPLTDLVIGLLAVALVATGVSVAAGVALVELGSFVLNLVPRRRVAVSDGIHATDGWQIVRALRGDVSLGVQVRRADALRTAGRLDAALQQLDAITDPSASRLARNQMVVWLIEGGRFEDARTLCIHELWSRGGGESSAQRAILLNNAAYSGILARNRAFLAEDRSAALEAVKLQPGNHSIMNTAGLALSLNGDAEAGWTWCLKALGQLGAPPLHQAVRLASLAIAKAVQGDVRETDRLAAEALHMDSSVQVMSLVVTAYTRAIPPGTIPPLPVTESGRPDVLLAMARCDALGVLGRWSDATVVAMRTLDAAGPNASRRQRALLCNHLAWCSLMSGDPRHEGAAEAAVQGLEALGVEDPMSARTLGSWYIRHGDLQRGLQLSEQALQSALRPQERAAVLANVALGLSRSGDRSGAAERFAQARDIDASAPFVAEAERELALGRV